MLTCYFLEKLQNTLFGGMKICIQKMILIKNRTIIIYSNASNISSGATFANERAGGGLQENKYRTNEKQFLPTKFTLACF